MMANEEKLYEGIITNDTTRSPEDERDWNSESIYDESFSLPSTFDLRPQLNRIRNQGTQGTCAAQTAACMKEWQEKKDVNFDDYMSPQFIYNYRVNQDKSGMYGRDVMRILSNIGSCSESLYPYNTIESKGDIDEKYYSEASNYKIRSYARVNTIDSLKRALYVNGPCYISFPVYNHGSRMWKQKKGQQRIGGHAMTVVGYNKDGFIIRNTWGIVWGKLGYCTYPYSDWGCHQEIWTTVDDESFKKPINEPTFFQSLWRECVRFFESMFSK